MIKRFLKILAVLLLLSIAIFFLYFNNTNRANPIVRNYYYALKDSLKQKGYKSNLIVISSKRAKWHNKLLAKYNGAAKDSEHIDGDAIDFIVLDINNDGEANAKDVDIVFELLDKEILKDKGGIGTYKNEKSFVDKQMIHIDGRGTKAIWAK